MRKHYLCNVSTVLYPSPIFGPVHSRRLGISLGINLLPEDGKVCTFDCIYCECGFNGDHHPHKPMPTREMVSKELEVTLKSMAATDQKPDVLTFAGNGEPTVHPKFSDIIDDTLILRDKYCPGAKVSVLSNATLIHREDVFNALLKVDNNIQKLDTIDTTYINMVDRPTGHYDVNSIIDQLIRFNGHVIIQTMFMKGMIEGEDVSNLSDRFVLPWLETVRCIAPQQVMIYTIDRDTPTIGLLKASPQELNYVRDKVIDVGIPCSASY